MRQLLDALIDPRSTERLDGPGWNLLLLQARHHGLLARLCLDLLEARMSEAVPPAAWRQLLAARTAAEANQAALRFETGRVRAVLCGHGFPVVLLKGGAYLAAGLPASRGRSSADLDILVPRDRLGWTEAALCGAGWQLKDVTDHDDRYYREWMHELPPFWHPDREMSLDVHHTIFPPVSGVVISGEALLAAARPLGGGGLAILDAPDMVLHAVLHLFGEDTSDRLRDLVDIRDLLRTFCAEQPGFWQALVARADMLGVGWALAHAFDHLAALLRVPIPPDIQEAVAARHGGAPWRLLTQRIIGASIIGGIRGECGPWPDLARSLAYLRSHWIRMPPLLLASHLWVKAWRRRGDGAVA